jgi:hypothetical protein
MSQLAKRSPYLGRRRVGPYQILCPTLRLCGAVHWGRCKHSSSSTDKHNLSAARLIGLKTYRPLSFASLIPNRNWRAFRRESAARWLLPLTHPHMASRIYRPGRNPSGATCVYDLEPGLER